MEKIKINRDSWHYKIADAFDTAYKCDDICSYNRKIIKNLIAFAILATLGIAVLASISQALVGLVFALIYGLDILTPWSEAVLIVVSVFLGSLSVVMVGNSIADYFYYRKQEKKKDMFLSEAYRAFKEKYCARIEYGYSDD